MQTVLHPGRGFDAAFCEVAHGDFSKGDFAIVFSEEHMAKSWAKSLRDSLSKGKLKGTRTVRTAGRSIKVHTLVLPCWVVAIRKKEPKS